MPSRHKPLLIVSLMEFEHSQMHGQCLELQFPSTEGPGTALSLTVSINPIALRKAKIVCNFGLFKCNRIKLQITVLILKLMDIAVLGSFLSSRRVQIPKLSQMHQRHLA